MLVLVSVFYVSVVVGVLTYGTGMRVSIARGRRLRFWHGPIGRWLIRTAGVGVAAPQLAPPVTHRPTEFALGAAAEALFEALPKPVRAQLPEVPRIVRRLERIAQRMRGRVEECADLLARVGPESPAARSTSLRAGSDAGMLDERRRAVRAELGVARDAAQHYLADAVASLEAIRLDVMRLRAGVGGVEAIVADLAAAGRVGDAADRLFEAQGGVVLDTEVTRPRTTRDTPEDEDDGYH